LIFLKFGERKGVQKRSFYKNRKAIGVHMRILRKFGRDASTKEENLKKFGEKN
jgi:hypothetical protein